MATFPKAREAVFLRQGAVPLDAILVSAIPVELSGR
jgi:hypothetical protein